MAAGDRYMTLLLDEIDVRDNHRAVSMETVKRLASSIHDIGLQYPITTMAKDGRFVLVAGRHRLEAVRMNGDDRIPAYVVKLSDIDARMWEISENLHRAELTTEQRYEQIAEYVRLSKEKRESEVSSHSATKPQGGRPEGGDRAAARDLGLSKDQVIRAQDYASLPPDVKERAIAEGVNVTRLLRSVDQSKPEPEPAKVAPTPLNDFETREQWVSYMMRGWNRASGEWREHFLSLIDHAVFDSTKAGQRA